MKKNNQNALAFKKTAIIELNETQLLNINGGTNPVITVPLVIATAGAVSFGFAVSVVAIASLVEGATDAIQTN